MPTGSYLEGADVGNHHRLRVWILTTSRMRIPSAYHDQLYDRFASDKHLGSNRFGNSPSHLDDNRGFGSASPSVYDAHPSAKHRDNSAF